MHVLFVEPSFPRYQRQFVRGLAAVGARVTGLGESPAEALDDELRGWLSGYERVSSVTNEDALRDAVRRLQQRGWVDRLEATIEAHVLPAAHVREACAIPGTSVRTAFLCRDKPAMKDALRAAGVPCARSTGASSTREVHAFADEVGFPLILKPRNAAGAAGTYKAEDPGELERVIQATGVGQGAPVALEEFIEGHEGFYDTIAIEGEVVHDFISHYYPNVLEAMRARWISPQILHTNRMKAPGYDEVKAMGKKVIRALGIGTSATHMEWFYGSKGLKFSEIGCRPPGVAMWDLYCAGNDLDVYTEWAKAVVHGRTESRCSRRFATGMIALRPERDGRIAGYEGIETIQAKYRENIIDSHFPPPGSTTQAVEAGYMANAWMRVRHEDYDTLRGILDEIGETVRVRTR
jgi:formate-dependent phosphoribosylglycinamide formyltransferase (GAR transformylase)